MIKMYSSDGGVIKVIPAKKDEMLEKGWTLDKPSKTKPKEAKKNG